MNRKTSKKIEFLLIVLFIIVCILMISQVNAGSLTISGGPIAPDKTTNAIAGRVFYVAAIICYTAAVIVVMIKGVQFMFAAPEAKAKIKEESIAIVIGAVIVFSIGAILTIIANVSTQLF